MNASTTNYSAFKYFIPEIGQSAILKALQEVKRTLHSVWVNQPGFTALVFITILTGSLVLFSNVLTLTYGALDDSSLWIQKYAVWYGIGGLGMWLAMIIPTKTLCARSQLILLAVCVLLVLTFVAGLEVNGAKRWLRIGGMTLQPSELAKLAVLIYLASYTARHLHTAPLSWSKCFKPLFLIGIVLLPILVQPDFGTTTLIASVSLLLLFVMGMRVLQLLACAALGAVAAIALVVSSPYRLARWESFVDPTVDPYGSAYQITQALISAARGGWTGQGLGRGIQKEGYLPEVHNDYIFASLLEETGLMGGAFVLLLFFGLFVYSSKFSIQALRREMPLHAALSLGIGMIMLLQSLIHMGATVNLVPPKGINLPLFSAGGSSLVVSLIGLGILFRIASEVSQTPLPHRQDQKFPQFQRKLQTERHGSIPRYVSLSGSLSESLSGFGSKVSLVIGYLNGGRKLL